MKLYSVILTLKAWNIPANVNLQMENFYFLFFFNTIKLTLTPILEIIRKKNYSSATQISRLYKISFSVIKIWAITVKSCQ